MSELVKTSEPATTNMRNTPRDILEESAIHWKRDWDALFIGFVLGFLAALVGVSIWG